MATPVETTILDAIATVLAGVTTANGYEVTITVARADEPGNVPADLGLILDAQCANVTEDEKWRGEIPLMRDGYLLTVRMNCWRAQATDNRDTALAKMASAVRKAIDANYTFTNRVELIYWKPDQLTLTGPGSAIPGLLLSFDALFYTLANNPYSQ